MIMITGQCDREVGLPGQFYRNTQRHVADAKIREEALGIGLRIIVRTHGRSLIGDVVDTTLDDVSLGNSNRLDWP